MAADVLKTSLLDLWDAIGPAANRILLGGGYGLYLKQQHLAQAGESTLIPIDLWPVPRVTQDLDLFLTTEIVADVKSMGAIREALDSLNYRVIDESKYLQFVREISETQVVKIDLLTTQLDELKDTAGIKADDRRARPTAKDRPNLHADPTDGALGLTESALTLEVTGELTSGTAANTMVRIPHPFSYLLMKLTAYRDRKEDPSKELGQHHALDIFRIAAMLTQHELAEVIERVDEYESNPQVSSCREVARSDFADATASGVLGMRRHDLWQDDAPLETFLGVISDIFNR